MQYKKWAICFAVLTVVFFAGFTYLACRDDYPSRVWNRVRKILNPPAPITTELPDPTEPPLNDDDVNDYDNAYTFLSGTRMDIVYQAWYNSVSAYKAKTILVGDSVTFRTDWNELLPGKEISNFAIGGTRVEELLEMMPLFKRVSPDTVFVMIGINDIISSNSYAYIIKTYDAVLCAFEDIGCKVYVESILPTCYTWEVLNDKILRVNEALRKLAAKHSFEYLNLYPLFVTDEGILDERYTNEGDGIHLSLEGYRVMGEAIAELVP